MSPDRWEHGSEFHWPRLDARGAPTWPQSSRWFGSGRDALRTLLRFGRQHRGWKRLLVPSYFCQEVVSSAAEEIPVAAYGDRPTLVEPKDVELHAAPSDVVLNVNFFGLRDARFSHPGLGVDVIEDHSHDPWSSWVRESRATFCLASLRKTLPIPDGGIVWSPTSQNVPDEPKETGTRARASAQKLSSMVLKSLYLGGSAVEKDAFRRLALAGEAEIASGEVSGMSHLTRALLDALPVEAWREQRHRNHATLSQFLSDVSVLSGAGTGTTPFSVIVILADRAERDRVKASLIQARIYPAVLWPMDEPVVSPIHDADRDLAERMLSLHCDFRYDAVDLRRVADTFHQALAGAK